VARGGTEERHTLVYPITITVKTLGAQAATDAPPPPPPLADDDHTNRWRRPCSTAPSSSPAAQEGPGSGEAHCVPGHSRLGPTCSDGNAFSRGDALGSVNDGALLVPRGPETPNPRLSRSLTFGKLHRLIWPLMRVRRWAPRLLPRRSSCPS
jgi:hypothetical protein